MLHFIESSNKAIALLCSCLHDKTQFVATRTGTTTMNHVYRGVPQGYFFGLLLFCINTCHLIKDLIEYAEVKEANHCIYKDLSQSMRLTLGSFIHCEQNPI